MRTIFFFFLRGGGGGGGWSRLGFQTIWNFAALLQEDMSLLLKSKSFIFFQNCMHVPNNKAVIEISIFATGIR